MPDKPWAKLHIDFKGPLSGGKYLLVIIDRYSRYPEVEIMNVTNSATVVRKLKYIFAAHGIPEFIVTENGQPFRSKEFKENIQEIGTFHKFSTPYLPQGNAEVERFMKTLGKVMSIAEFKHDDLEDSILRSSRNRGPPERYGISVPLKKTQEKRDGRYNIR